MPNQKSKKTVKETETEVEFFDRVPENIIPLRDGDSEKEVQFYQVACVDMDGEFYALLEPVEDLPDISVGEVAVFRLQEDKDTDSDLLLPVENETTMRRVFDAYLKAAADEGCGCGADGCEDCADAAGADDGCGDGCDCGCCGHAHK
ncbi:MAG: DUF1292 domain-containing protein [Clostridiales bacterium]|jgi:hypothetical protein|nr:DUF1292 domain-containing protein [Clostridiales bacterium]